MKWRRKIRIGNDTPDTPDNDTPDTHRPTPDTHDTPNTHTPDTHTLTNISSAQEDY